MSSKDEEELLRNLGLKEYEVTALKTLLSVGRTTAPNLAEATGIPKARIYGVLDSLSEMGYVKVIPGRPKEFQPKSPKDIIERAMENRRQKYEEEIREIEEIEEEIIETFEPRYETTSEDITPTEELFHVVDVGEPSERETRRLYHDAEEEVNIITKGFEYFDNVETAFDEAVERGVDVKVLFLDPRKLADENKEVQEEVVEHLNRKYPGVGIRFSPEPLPWRGTFTDPDMEYETGEAVLLVEEKDIPLHMRQAAVTENGPFVAGMKRYFDLIWKHESFERDEV